VIVRRLFWFLLSVLLVVTGASILTVKFVEAQQPADEAGGSIATPEPMATSSPGESGDQSALPETSATPTLPLEGDNSSPTPAPTATAVLALTGLGWFEESDSPAPAADVSILALTPIDCAILPAPVVGFEISRGQDPDDISDFINDLTTNGFNVGSVDISGGVNPPPCVDVLIVYGLTQNRAISSPYTPAEGALLQVWAASGHGLMLFGDWGNFRAGTDALFQTYGYSQQGPNPVTDITDFDSPAPPPPNAWVIYQTDNFAGHPILNGVNSLELLAGSWLSSATDAIITADADAVPANAPVMAAFAAGAGCVTLVTDSNWVGAAGGGYFKQNNATVARQAIQWLNGCTNLKLSKVATPNPVQAGGLLTFTLTAINDSVAAVNNTIITDTVPLSTSFVSATGPFSGPDANGVVTWSLGVLNPNTSASVTMLVQVDSLTPLGAIIANTAWITSSQGLSDTATTFTPVNVPLVDPRVVKAVNKNQIQPGEVVTFTLTVSQTGQSNGNATNVRVTDALPNEVDLLGNPEVNAGFTQVSGRVVTWTIPVLAPGDVRLMTLRVQVNDSNPPPLTIRNQATLRFDQGADRLSNQVELFVPALAPPPTTDDNDDNDNDNNNDNESEPAATATPVPATPIAIVQSAAPAVLPVTLLPETGSRAAELPLRRISLSVALLLAGVIGMLLKFRLR
jgi:uncharacterized repeat protein (TIGR01451 family)